VTVLSASGLTKRFPGVIALDGVDFNAHAGEVHALLGENGAGKSTLVKVITGVYPRDGGDLLLEGRSIAPTSPLAAQKLGISTVYQEVNLIPALSVAENISLGRAPTRFGFLNRRQMQRDAESALQRLDVHMDVRRPLQSCSIALQQMVAIARSLTMSAKLLILDEPTSSLDRAEVQRLFATMHRLKEQGLAIIFVTHFIDQVYAVSDRITVLRNGKLVGESLTKNLRRLELVARMVGRDPQELAAEHVRPSVTSMAARTLLLEAKGLGRRHGVEPLDLSIAKGEVIGLAGLLGSGRTETAELLFGVKKHDAGAIHVDGKLRRIRKPRHAIALGFGFCPEDRKIAGILGDLSIRENIAIALQARRGWWRPLSWRKQNALAEQYIQLLRIKNSDADKPIRLLSGGNQQKCILARWLASSPRLLILDEPTRGIDIGAKGEIAALIDQLREQGMSLLVISSEIEELVRVCSRVVILRDRRKIGELQGGDVSEVAIFQRIAG
jgi:galactofuranose transport system ATP-binding protein